MAEVIRETEPVRDDGAQPVRRTQVVDNRDQVVTHDSVAARVVWLIAGIIATILAFRFVLILMGANSANGFANFIYSVSHPFAAPFFGLFSYTQQYGQSRFELSTLFAIAVYLLVAFGIAKAITIRRPRQA